MRIKIYNDGKQKIQSYEANLDLTFPTCYGETEEEVIELLREQVIKLQEKLNALDYSKPVQVNWVGKELAEAKLLAPYGQHSAAECDDPTCSHY